MKFSEKLFFLRKQHGMTQIELAENLDVSRQTISKWESGESFPSAENLAGIGKVFNVAMDTLMDEGIEFRENVAVAIAEKINVVEDKKRSCVRNLKVLVTVAAVLATVVSVIVFWFYESTEQDVDPIRLEDMTPEYIEPSEVIDWPDEW